MNDFMCISYLLQYITHDPLFVFVQLYNTYCIWLMNWKSFHIPHSLESLPCLESVLAAWMNVLSALYLRRTEVFFSSQTSTWKRLRYWCTKIKSLIIFNAVTSLWINGSCAPLLPKCVCVCAYIRVYVWELGRGGCSNHVMSLPGPLTNEVFGSVHLSIFKRISQREDTCLNMKIGHR